MKVYPSNYSTTADVPTPRCPSCSYPEHGSIACSQVTRIAPVSEGDSLRRERERYELRYAVGHRYDCFWDLRDRLGIPKTSRIIGASFQAGAAEGHGDTVVLLIERPVEAVNVT